jgi:hypothetical protein
MKNLVNFFFKKKDVVLDCFTFVPHAYDYAKIDSALNHLPDWFKKTPKIGKDENGNDEPKNATIKSCVGLIDLYKKGIVIPSWFEIDIKINPNSNKEETAFTWEASNSFLSTSNSHNPRQFQGFAKEHGGNLKLSTPWAFKTKEEIFFTWTQPTWHYRDFLGSLTNMPAVVEFKYNHGTEINYFYENKEHTQEINIPPLTPLVMLHPMTERNVIIKNHLVPKEEFDRLHGSHNFLFQRHGKDSIKFYQTKRRLVDRVEEQNNENQSKCPFSSSTSIATKFISKDRRNIK